MAVMSFKQFLKVKAAKGIKNSDLITFVNVAEQNGLKGAKVTVSSGGSEVVTYPKHPNLDGYTIESRGSEFCIVRHSEVYDRTHDREEVTYLARQFAEDANK